MAIKGIHPFYSSMPLYQDKNKTMDKISLAGCAFIEDHKIL